MIQWRPRLGALGALTLVMGTAAAIGTPAQADTGAAPATGHVIGWADGAVTATYPAEGGPAGPWARLGENGLGANAVGALRADGGVDVVASAQASAQAVPAHVSGQQTVSLSVGGPRSIWAASADGSVTKWGGSRGSFPDQTWTAEQLGGKALAVSGSVYRAYALVETPEGAHHVTVIAYGPDAVGGTEGVSPVVSGETGAPVTDVVALGAVNRDPGFSFGIDTLALRADGSLVVLSDGQGWYDVRPAGDDPVVAFGSRSGESGTGVAATGTFVTQSGKSYGFRLVNPNSTVPWAFETWQDDNFPGVPAGQSVKEVNATGDASTGSPQFLLTDQGDVVAWRSEPQAGGDTPADVPLPEVLAAGGVLDIADGAYALLEVDAAALAATAAPTVSGTPRVGETLTGTPATFNDASATVTNQWKADGVAIEGATGTTLSLTAAQLGTSITFTSTATRGDETVSSTSAVSGPVQEALAPLAVTTVPTVTGTAQVGKVLTGTPAVFNDATATVTNQWKANGVAISGATGTTLSLSAAQQGKSITFVSTATRGSDSLASSSAARGPVAAAPIVKTFSKAPTIAVTLKPTSRTTGRATVVVARAVSSRPVPTGTVRVTIVRGTTKRIVSGTLSSGRRVVVLPKLAKGTWKVRVDYLGDRYYKARSSALVTLVVTR